MLSNPSRTEKRTLELGGSVVNQQNAQGFDGNDSTMELGVYQVQHWDENGWENTVKARGNEG